MFRCLQAKQQQNLFTIGDSCELQTVKNVKGNVVKYCELDIDGLDPWRIFFCFLSKALSCFIRRYKYVRY